MFCRNAARGSHPVAWATYFQGLRPEVLGLEPVPFDKTLNATPAVWLHYLQL